MTGILVPIDGLQDHTRLAARVTDLYRRAPAAVHLLSIQPPFNQHVAGFFSSQAIRDFHREEGMRELTPIQRLLRDAGVPSLCHVEVGRHADTISRMARALGCQHIVMRGDAHNMMSRIVLGSLVSQVQHLLAGVDTVCELV